jgi:hypothetical protein
MVLCNIHIRGSPSRVALERYVCVVSVEWRYKDTCVVSVSCAPRHTVFWRERAKGGKKAVSCLARHLQGVLNM